jgi:hypothetical protein
MKNENSPKKEIFCHYLKNFVTKLQLKMKTMLLEKKNRYLSQNFNFLKKGFLLLLTSKLCLKD